MTAEAAPIMPGVTRVIAHGVDLVHVPRIARMVEEHGDRFLARCFTPGEIAYSTTPSLRPERLAARFAAKEAVMKALGVGWTRGVAWTDIAVTRDATGRPGVALTGQALAISHEVGVSAWMLSLTHAGEHAMASVIALGEA